MIYKTDQTGLGFSYKITFDAHQLSPYLVFEVRDVVAQGVEAAVDLLHPVPLPGIATGHRRSLQRPPKR